MEDNRIQNQIAIYMTNKKLCEFTDKLKPAPIEYYAHMHAQGEEQADGIRAYSCIGVVLQDYDDLVDGKYLYNRCHLIGYQLTGENANTKNLITGTRYLNIEGMLPFENMVADYIEETNNHVLYRVTPIFEGNNLLANGVLMEGYSVEDKGAGVSYCVFAYNVQPGIEIDYATGESKLADGAQQEEQKTATVTPTPSPEPEKQEPVTGSEASQADYILNTNTKKFHYPTCSSVNDMKEKNKQEFFGTRDETIALGYSPCGRCKP